MLSVFQDSVLRKDFDASLERLNKIFLYLCFFLLGLLDKSQLCLTKWCRTSLQQVSLGFVSPFLNSFFVVCVVEKLLQMSLQAQSGFCFMSAALSMSNNTYEVLDICL